MYPALLTLFIIIDSIILSRLLNSLGHLPYAELKERKWDVVSLVVTMLFIILFSYRMFSSLGLLK